MSRHRGAPTASMTSHEQATELTPLEAARTAADGGASAAKPAGLVSDPSSAASSAYPQAEAEGEKKKSETDLPPAYLAYLESLRAAWSDLPELTITYSDLTYEAQVPVATAQVQNLGTYYRDVVENAVKFVNPFHDASGEMRTFRPLQGATGVVRPGELTLVLAPPGHGKSMLLKALAGRMQRESSNLRGEVRWNGLTGAESAAAGQELSKLCAFVDQGEVHYPILTVRETFQFALDNSNASAAHLAAPEFAAKQEKKVELMLELLGLKECADTIVGNAMLRGVSGGQKRRVTLGEMMITQARALFLDEISTGLDAAATFDIVSALKKWTRVMRGSATVALLQPAPEVAAMFDNVILLREGAVVFSGTWPQLQQHLADCRITPNPELDFADWLTEFLTDPIAVWRRDVEARGKPSSMRSFRQSFREEHPQEAARVPVGADESATPTSVKLEPVEAREVIFHVGSDDDDAPLVDAEVAARAARLPRVERKVERKQHKAEHKADHLAVPTVGRSKGLGQVVSAVGIPLTTAALRKAYEALQFYQAQSWSLWHHTKTCLRRQWLFMIRSPEFMYPRIFQSIVMGLVMGSLYYQLGVGPSDFSARLGLVLFAISDMSFNNLTEIPLASEFKLVVYKQVDAGFYSTFSYVFSVVLMHMMLAASEAFLHTITIYWMAGFDPDAGRFFFFMLTLFMVNLAISSVLRAVAYLSRNPDVAMSTAIPIVCTCQVFGGFLVTADKIPDWMIWIYYLSPFAWGLKSIALNEFKSEQYPAGVGDTYLETYQISRNDQYKWAGIGYLGGLWVLCIIVSAAALKYQRFWLTTGTKRVDMDEEEAAAIHASVEVRIGAKSTSMVAAAHAAKQREETQQLTFARMDLSFVDLKYSVPVAVKDEATGKQRTVQRQLLAGINGFARAGELTALMGSSGAGKTTLMDVIAGRKTAGAITGQILVDGRPQAFPAFNRLMGYCEQTDVHIGTDTVREAIEFSAKLRLPASVSDEVRAAFVDQILEDLELTPIAHRLVGDGNIEGLSPGQLKRLTIGVELAANPTFLFLDEPTSGLDSRAALIVCRVIRKIARRGRAVVCTIHQPSAELFGMFDRLLLLKSGGKEVYFGPIGEGGVDVASYFMNADIGPDCYRPSLPDKVNPASWMLDVIGAGTSAKGQIAAYDEVYVASPLRAENMAEVQRLATPVTAPAGDDNAPPRFEGIYALSYGEQLYVVLRRMFSAYYRDTAYNAAKFFMCTFLGLLLGLVCQGINDDDEAGMLSKVSIMFFACTMLGVQQGSNAPPVVFRLRGPFYRERASNTYAPWIYTASLMLVEIPYVFVCSVLFVVPFYFLVGLESNGEKFFQYLLVMYLTALLFCYMGQLYSSIMPTIQLANMFQGVLYPFVFLFGGTYIQKNAMPIGWHWLYYILPVPKGVIPLAIQQFYCEGAECPTLYSTQMDGRVVTKWEWVAHYFGTAGPDWDHYYIAYIMLSIVVLTICLAITVQKVSHVKR